MLGAHLNNFLLSFTFKKSIKFFDQSNRLLRILNISEKISNLARERNFELRGYRFPCPKEQLRPARIVRVGLIQNQICRPTNDPIVDQRQSLHNRIAEILNVAMMCGVNVCCFQECWSMFFQFV